MLECKGHGKDNQGTRDRKILEIVKGLLLSEVAFQEIFKKYKEGYLRFLDIGSWVDDKGHSLLYSVKEQCHAIFRYLKRVLSIKRNGSSILPLDPSFTKP